MVTTVNLTPSTRVLRMLGEIDFKAWQCLCELIDNSIDSFTGEEDVAGRIDIKLPRRNRVLHEGITISDNGPGMDSATLEKSMRAGYSGNDPIEKMGLFGMGFNIATARLGQRVEVRTTREDLDHWLSVTVDFKEMELSGSFEVPVTKIAKDPHEMAAHGTSITISKLREEHVKALYNKGRITKQLGKIYGRVLRNRKIRLLYDGARCKPFEHCCWDESRAVEHRRFGRVPAVIKIDEELDPKQYCTNCWVWLSDQEVECSSCGTDESLVMRTRSIRGWIGIQRFFDKKHYGVDLIRNGRVIEELDKSFFTYYPDDDEGEEILEYPIDATYAGGRIVGELEIDFVRVTHQKDSFVKATRDWRSVVQRIRGSAPMQPLIAKKMGLPENDSPMAQLFSAYRKVKAGKQCLVPGAADGRAMIQGGLVDEYRESFFAGDPEYQSDDKWWALVEQADGSIHTPSVPPSPGSEQDPPDSGATGGSPFEPQGEPPAPPSPGEVGYPTPKYVAEFTRLDYLSQVYSVDCLPEVEVGVVVEVNSEDSHEIGISVEARGHRLTLQAWLASDYFLEGLTTLEECVVNELAHQMQIVSQTSLRDHPISEIEAALRHKYFPALFPTIEGLNHRVQSFFEEMKSHLATRLPDRAPIDLAVFSAPELARARKSATRQTNLDSSDIDALFLKGGFIHYASPQLVAQSALEFPDCVFDGDFFSRSWSSELAAKPGFSLLDEFASLLEDLQWIRDNPNATSSPLWLPRVRRGVASLLLLDGWRDGGV